LLIKQTKYFNSFDSRRKLIKIKTRVKSQNTLLLCLSYSIYTLVQGWLSLVKPYFSFKKEKSGVSKEKTLIQKKARDLSEPFSF